MKNVFLSFVVFGTLFLHMGCSSKTTSDQGKDVQRGGGSSDVAPNVNLTTLPVVSIDAPDLYAEYKADREATAAKYKGKSLLVSGVVNFAHSNNAGDQPMVVLFGLKDTEKAATQMIQCMLPVADELGRGQAVKIKGILGDFGFGVPLINCELVDAGTSTVIQPKIATLIADYKMDTDAAEKKYENKSARLTGKVADLKWEMPNNKVVVITLVDDSGTAKDPARIDIRCEGDINPKILQKLKKIEKGQTITVQGECEVKYVSMIKLRGGRILK